MKNSPQDQVAQVASQVEQSTQENKERRAFLKTAAVAAGGLALGLQLSSRADDTTSTPVAATTAAETVVPIPEKVLAAVGGFDVVEAAGDKIIVVRTDAKSVAACSAICTHKGCTLGYDAGTQQLACPCHGARFDLNGKVLKGPARKDLKSYNARLALGLSAKN